MAQSAGFARRRDFDSINGARHQSLNFSARIRARRFGSGKSAEKAKEFANATVLAEGTTDENFTKAPAKS
jgi:hypothetical protein